MLTERKDFECPRIAIRGIPLYKETPYFRIETPRFLALFNSEKVRFLCDEQAYEALRSHAGLAIYHNLFNRDDFLNQIEQIRQFA